MKICEQGGCMSKLGGIQLTQMLNEAGLNPLAEFQDSARFVIYNRFWTVGGEKL